jgi:hypothetical protein
MFLRRWDSPFLHFVEGFAQRPVESLRQENDEEDNNNGIKNMRIADEGGSVIDPNIFL